MGVQGLTPWLLSMYREVEGQEPTIDSQTTGSSSGKHSVQNFFHHVHFDMNCIVHHCVRTHPQRTEPIPENCTDLVHSLSQSIIDCIWNLMMHHSMPILSLTLCFDGPTPYAKIPQQRNRRASLTQRRAPLEQSITTGSSLLRDIERSVANEIVHRLRRWCMRHGRHHTVHVRVAATRGAPPDSHHVAFTMDNAPLEVYLSSSCAPEEGEVKIVQRIHQIQSETLRFKHRDSEVLEERTRLYDETSHCIIGCDSDLVLVAMACTRSLSLTLLNPFTQLKVCLSSIFLSFLEPMRRQIHPYDLSFLAALRLDFVVLALLNGNEYMGPLQGYTAKRAWESYLSERLEGLAANRGRPTDPATRQQQTTNPPPQEAHFSEENLFSPTFLAFPDSGRCILVGDRLASFLQRHFMTESGTGDNSDTLAWESGENGLMSNASETAGSDTATRYIEALKWSVVTYVEGRCPDFGFVPPSVMYAPSLREFISVFSQVRSSNPSVNTTRVSRTRKRSLPPLAPIVQLCLVVREPSLLPSVIRSRMDRVLPHLPHQEQIPRVARTILNTLLQHGSKTLVQRPEMDHDVWRVSNLSSRANAWAFYSWAHLDRPSAQGRMDEAQRLRRQILRVLRGVMETGGSALSPRTAGHGLPSSVPRAYKIVSTLDHSRHRTFYVPNNIIRPNETVLPSSVIQSNQSIPPAKSLALQGTVTNPERGTILFHPTATFFLQPTLAHQETWETYELLDSELIEEARRHLTDAPKKSTPSHPGQRKASSDQLTPGASATAKAVDLSKDVFVGNFRVATREKTKRKRETTPC